MWDRHIHIFSIANILTTKQFAGQFLINFNYFLVNGIITNTPQRKVPSGKRKNINISPIRGNTANANNKLENITLHCNQNKKSADVTRRRSERPRKMTVRPFGT